MALNLVVLGQSVSMVESSADKSASTYCATQHRKTNWIRKTTIYCSYDSVVQLSDLVDLGLDWLD